MSVRVFVQMDGGLNGTQVTRTRSRYIPMRDGEGTVRFGVRRQTAAAATAPPAVSRLAIWRRCNDPVHAGTGENKTTGAYAPS